jgi:hypothetical protein
MTQDEFQSFFYSHTSLWIQVQVSHMAVALSMEMEQILRFYGRTIPAVFFAS